jgi:hypothetical protein
VVLAAVCGLAVLSGCMPKMTVQEMKDMMPKRPAELDHLNMWAGSWEFSGEAKMAMLEEPMQTSGESEAAWAGDNWYMISNGVFRMGELGESKGHEVWTYDAKAKKFRSSWADSMGMMGYGEGTYDADTRTWKMKATGYGPWGKSSMKGTAKFINDDTVEFTWAEYSGLTKTMEMTGTSHRK